MFPYLAVAAFTCAAFALLRYAVGIAALRRFIRRADLRRIEQGPTPPISLLKPLYGGEPALQENLLATLRQNYPEFEVLLLHERDDDPALDAARAAWAQVPGVDLRQVAGRAPDAANPKVAVLIRGEQEARHEILAAADADVRPDPLYLRDIANGLQEADAVSFVPVLFGMRSFWARAMALIVNTDGFLALVLSRGAITTGATIAVGKTALEKAGGYRAVADLIADDYALGEALKAAGCSLGLARRAVRVHAPAGDLRWVVRWLKTVRSSAPLLYLSALPLVAAPALLVAVAFRYPVALLPLALLALAQAAVAVAVDLRFVWDRSLVRSLWLVPLVWLLAPLGWLLGWFGSTVTWRGRRYRIARGRVRVLGP